MTVSTVSRLEVLWSGTGYSFGLFQQRRLLSLEAALPVEMKCIPAGTIVPVPHSGHKLHGVRASPLGHRGLAGLSPAPQGWIPRHWGAQAGSPTALGVEPGQYRDSASVG